MFNRNKSKRHDIKKTVKSAVKEEIKNTVKSTLVQDFLDYSAKTIETNDKIESDLYIKNNVKRGLRNSNGTGVVVGLTKIGDVRGYEVDSAGNKIPTEGKLYYRGYSVEDLVKSCSSEGRFGFEEVTFLLIFGKLPTKSELADFNRALGSKRKLPNGFARDMILTAPSNSIMNKLARSVLALYCYDDKPDDTSVPNVLRQSIDLIGYFPALIAYAYQAKSSFYDHKSLHLHNPVPELSTSENILHMIRPTGEYTELEARLLDICMILHAEHGGGNNSSFTTHLISSTGTDTYSAISAAIGSLKGPRHGGANIAVINMIQDLKANVPDFNNRGKLDDYLVKTPQKRSLRQEGAGLWYGTCDIYSVRSKSENYSSRLCEETCREQGTASMTSFSVTTSKRRTPATLCRNHMALRKTMPANVDLYSGFVYDALEHTYYQ